MNCLTRRHNWVVDSSAAMRLAVMVMLLLWGCDTERGTLKPVDRTDMKQITVEGINIAHIERGNGDPLVLSHGSPTSSFLWRNMMDALSEHGRIIALDLPGFGYSDPPKDGDYTIANYARILESFLEALSVEEATILCHDYGGPIALAYALHHPEKVQRLVILNTFLHTDLPPWPLSWRIAQTWPLGEAIMWLAGGSIVRSSLEAGVADKSRITDDIYHRYYMPEGTPDKLNASMLGTLRADYEEDVAFIESNPHTINKPTLVLWGEKDAFFPIRLGEWIHRDIAGSQMVKIPDAGHFVPEDRPHEAARIIGEFLESSSDDGDAIPVKQST